MGSWLIKKAYNYVGFFRKLLTTRTIENYYITLVTQINQLVKISIIYDIIVSFMIYICIGIKAQLQSHPLGILTLKIYNYVNEHGNNR